MGNQPSGDNYVVDSKEVFQSYRIPQKAYKKKKSASDSHHTGAGSGPRSSESSSISSTSTNQPAVYHFTASQRLYLQQLQQQQKRLQPQQVQPSSSRGGDSSSGRRREGDFAGGGRRSVTDDDIGAGVSVGGSSAIPVPYHPQRVRSGSRQTNQWPSSHRGRPSSFPSRNSSCSSLDLSIINAALDEVQQQQQEFQQQRHHHQQPHLHPSYARGLSQGNGRGATTAAETLLHQHPNYPLLSFGPQNLAALESSTSLQSSSFGGEHGSFLGYQSDLDSVALPASEHDMPLLGTSLIGTGLGRATFIDGEIHPGYLGHQLTIQEFMSIQQQQQQQFLEHQQREYQKMVQMQQRQQMILQQRLLQLQQQEQQHRQQQQLLPPSPKISNSAPIQLGSQSQLANVNPMSTRAQRPARNPDRLQSSPVMPVSAIQNNINNNTLSRRPRNNTYSGNTSSTQPNLPHMASSPTSSASYHQPSSPQSPRPSHHSGQSSHYHHSHSHSAASSFGSSHGSSYIHQNMLAMTVAESGTSPPSSSSSSLSLSASLPAMNVNGTIAGPSTPTASTSALPSTTAKQQHSSRTSGKLDELASKISQPLQLMSGREYHPDKTIPYLLPCDEQESERLMMQHYVLRYAFGSNVIPPIDTTVTGKVLDCGCGPGTWVMEMATEYEDLDFYGFDISPMYPSAIHPKNSHFSYGNLLANEIPFESDSFVLVHQRNLLLGLPKEAWPAVIADLYRTVLPGGQGYLQLCEVDPIWCRPGPQSQSLLNRLHQTAQHHRVDIEIPQVLDSLLINAGCQHVHMLMVEIPIGPWGGKIGLLWRDVLKAEIDALKPFVLQASLDAQLAQGADRAVVGAEMTTAEEWDDIMNTVWAEMDQYRTFSRVYLAYGQKP